MNPNSPHVRRAVIFFPSSILTLAGGAIFGFGGIPLVWISAVCGQTGAFFVSRYLLRSWVSKWGEKYPVWNAVDAAIRDQALKIVILIRLATLVPYSAANALLPITSLSVRCPSLLLLYSMCFASIPAFLHGTAVASEHVCYSLRRSEGTCC